MTTQQASNLKPDSPVNFVLDGVLFTGNLLKLYTMGEGNIKAAVQVTSYFIEGRQFTAEADDSAVHVSAAALV